MEINKPVNLVAAALAMAGINPQEDQQDYELIAAAANRMTVACHGAALGAGWWTKPDGADIRDNPLTFSNKLLLIVSEVAESMEGDRKSLQDDKLPQYPMRLVELADVVIRAFDLAGAYNTDVDGGIFGEILAAKMVFNAQRPDHKPEARAAAGGKAY